MKLISINFEDDLYKAIDELRGTKPRSRMVCELLRENPKVQKHLKPNPPTPAPNTFKNGYGESRKK
jgi:metal-responsive CopG/Arc/MetJ family transcriptional regulator